MKRFFPAFVKIFLVCALASAPSTQAFCEVDSAEQNAGLEKRFVDKCANAFGWTDPGKPMGRRDLKELEDAAKNGNADAQFCAGALLFRGIWLDKNVKEAAALFKKSSDQGNPYGMAAYAYCLLNGEGVSPNPKEADSLFKKSAGAGCAVGVRGVGENLLKTGRSLDMQLGIEFLKSAAELGDVYSKTILASCYDRGIAVERDTEKGSRLLKEAADAGNAPALFALGMIAAQNKENPSAVFKFYERASRVKYPPALSAMGVCYLYGAGVAADYDRAVECLVMAAAEGVAEAQNALGVCYANGAGVEQDSQKAFEWFKRAAQLGDAEAQNNLGNCYYFGNGVGEDPKQAHKWFRLSAAQGNAAAQSSLALLYLEGKSEKREAKDAIVWLYKAAENGDVEAQSNLGKCLLEGIGVEKNYELAVKWLGIAAKNGDAQALGNLGACYYLGLGVEKDLEKAKELLKKSAQLGNEEARRAYYRISEE